MKALIATTPEIEAIEGIAIPDNREQRFEEIARDLVERHSGGRWEDVPPAARESLLAWIREWFHWLFEQQ